LTVSFLEGFRTYLIGHCGNGKNTVHKNLASIRTILYSAIREGRFPQENNPFFQIRLRCHPALQQQINDESDALVVPIILAVLKKKRLRKRLIGRGQQVTSRRSERYLENFDHIWNLQSFLLAEADHFNIPIILNMDEDEAIRSTMQIISDCVSRDISSKTEVSGPTLASHRT